MSADREAALTNAPSHTQPILVDGLAKTVNTGALGINSALLVAERNAQIPLVFLAEVRYVFSSRVTGTPCARRRQLKLGRTDLGHR